MNRHFHQIGHLSGWDIIAALLGFLLAAALSTVEILHSGYALFWIGGPAAFVLARRHFLPRLSPQRQVPARAPSALRHILGFAMMIGGGFVVVMTGLIAGAGAFAVVQSGRAVAWDDALALGVILAIFAVALWVVIRGIRAVS